MENRWRRGKKAEKLCFCLRYRIRGDKAGKKGSQREKEAAGVCFMLRCVFGSVFCNIRKDKASKEFSRILDNQKSIAREPFDDDLVVIKVALCGLNYLTSFLLIGIGLFIFRLVCLSVCPSVRLSVCLSSDKFVNIAESPRI